MGLKPVPSGRNLPIIAHSDGQEMVLQVGVLHAGAAADEPCGFELVRRTRPGPVEHPSRADIGLAQKVPIAREAHRLGRGHLDVKLQMILQVLAHAGPVGDQRDAMFGQMRGWPDPRQHQKLRRVDRRGRHDHLAPGPDDFGLAVMGELDTGGAALFDDDPPRLALKEPAMRARQRWPQIGLGRGPARALVDGRVERAKTLLLAAVVILRHRVSRLPPGLDKGAGQRVRPRPARDAQGAVRAAPIRIAAMPAAVPVFHPLEIREDIGIGPAIRAALGPSPPAAERACGRRVAPDQRRTRIAGQAALKIPRL